MPPNSSKNSKTFPHIDIIIPTLNSEKILNKCLGSIKKQNYPTSKIHLYISDGGSTDNTLKIAKKYHAHILKNTLKTAEAGKALGLKKSTSEIISFIDSDNILPHRNWLNQMILPLIKDSTIIGSEPIAFTYRKNAGFIERYSALIGANDPFAYFNGNYDRYSYLSNKWTNLKIDTEDFKSYLRLKIEDCRLIPTIGANGTLFRKNFLLKFFKGDYLFDIDLLAMAPKPLYFTKVKTGIIHTYCESSISKFIKKQQRRLTDYYTFKEHRQYKWSVSSKTIPFTFYSLLILPTLFDSIKGYFKKHDIAWFFHPIACWLTWWIYFIVTVKHKLNILKPLNRLQWQQ